jgi:hypothetical protein
VDWPNFLRGILYSFLPKQLWGSWRPSSTVDFARSALVSGLLESTFALFLLIEGYVHFLLMRIRQMQAMAQANEGTQLHFLVILSFEFIFHPFSLIAIYLVLEGSLRSWAAFFTDEVIPSFPIKLVVMMQERRSVRKQEASLGPPLPDRFVRIQEQELQIASQRPKGGWRISITVAINEEFYEIIRVEPGDDDRRFVYLLRRLPAGSVIRGFYRYDPPSELEQAGPCKTGAKVD